MNIEYDLRRLQLFSRTSTLNKKHFIENYSQGFSDVGRYVHLQYVNSSNGGMLLVAL